MPPEKPSFRRPSSQKVLGLFEDTPSTEDSLSLTPRKSLDEGINFHSGGGLSPILSPGTMLPSTSGRNSPGRRSSRERNKPNDQDRSPRRMPTGQSGDYANIGESSGRRSSSSSRHLMSDEQGVKGNERRKSGMQKAMSERNFSSSKVVESTQIREELSSMSHQDHQAYIAQMMKNLTGDNALQSRSPKKRSSEIGFSRHESFDDSWAPRAVKSSKNSNEELRRDSKRDSKKDRSSRQLSSSSHGTRSSTSRSSKMFKAQSERRLFSLADDTLDIVKEHDDMFFDEYHSSNNFKMTSQSHRRLTSIDSPARSPESPSITFTKAQSDRHLFAVSDDLMDLVKSSTRLTLDIEPRKAQSSRHLSYSTPSDNGRKSPRQSNAIPAKAQSERHLFSLTDKVQDVVNKPTQRTDRPPMGRPDAMRKAQSERHLFGHYDRGGRSPPRESSSSQRGSSKSPGSKRRSVSRGRRSSTRDLLYSNERRHERSKSLTTKQREHSMPTFELNLDSSYDKKSSEEKAHIRMSSSKSPAPRRARSSSRTRRHDLPEPMSPPPPVSDIVVALSTKHRRSSKSPAPRKERSKSPTRPRRRDSKDWEIRSTDYMEVPLAHSPKRSKSPGRSRRSRSDSIGRRRESRAGETSSPRTDKHLLSSQADPVSFESESTSKSPRERRRSRTDAREGRAGYRSSSKTRHSNTESPKSENMSRRSKSKVKVDDAMPLSSNRSVERRSSRRSSSISGLRSRSRSKGRRRESQDTGKEIVISPADPVPFEADNTRSPRERRKSKFRDTSVERTTDHSSSKKRHSEIESPKEQKISHRSTSESNLASLDDPLPSSLSRSEERKSSKRYNSDIPSQSSPSDGGRRSRRSGTQLSSSSVHSDEGRKARSSPSSLNRSEDRRSSKGYTSNLPSQSSHSDGGRRSRRSGTQLSSSSVHSDGGRRARSSRRTSGGTSSPKKDWLSLQRMASASSNDESIGEKSFDSSKVKPRRGKRSDLLGGGDEVEELKADDENDHGENKAKVKRRTRSQSHERTSKSKSTERNKSSDDRSESKAPSRRRQREMDKAAVVIQKWSRRHLKQRQFLDDVRKEKAAIPIQKVFRALHAKNVVSRLRKGKAAIPIQTALRVLLARTVVSRLKNEAKAAIPIQKAIRVLLAKNTLARLRKANIGHLDKACTKIQTRIRIYLAKLTTEKTKWRRQHEWEQEIAKYKPEKEKYLAYRKEQRTMLNTLAQEIVVLDKQVIQVEKNYCKERDRLAESMEIQKKIWGDVIRKRVEQEVAKTTEVVHDEELDELLPLDPNLTPIEQIAELEDEIALMKDWIEKTGSKIASKRAEASDLETANADVQKMFNELNEFAKKKVAEKKELNSQQMMLTKMLIPKAMKQAQAATEEARKEVRSRLLHRRNLYRVLEGVQSSEAYDHALYEEVMEAIQECESELETTMLEGDEMKELLMGDLEALFEIELSRLEALGPVEAMPAAGSGWDLLAKGVLANMGKKEKLTWNDLQGGA